MNLRRRCGKRSAAMRRSSRVAVPSADGAELDDLGWLLSTFAGAAQSARSSLAAVRAERAHPASVRVPGPGPGPGPGLYRSAWTLLRASGMRSALMGAGCPDRAPTG